MKVGTRELKRRLSYYLHRVQKGEPVLVTDRGQVVAELRGRPPAATSNRRRSDREVLAELAAEGLVTIGTGRVRARKLVRLRPGKLLSDMILEHRR